VPDPATDVIDINEELIKESPYVSTTAAAPLPPPPPKPILDPVELDPTTPTGLPAVPPLATPVF
jgi:hypothetical protein